MPMHIILIDLLEGKDFGTAYVVHDGTDLNWFLKLLADEEDVAPGPDQKVLILRPVTDLQDKDYVLFEGLVQLDAIPLGIDRHRDNVRGRTPTE